MQETGVRLLAGGAIFSFSTFFLAFTCLLMFVMNYEEALTFWPENEVLKCDHSND